MLKRILLSSRLCFFSALIITAPIVVHAASPTPSKEFLDYLNEYGDDDGNLLDPLEYDQILNMKESDDLSSDTASAVNELEALDKPSARNADMKIEKKSSTQASSSAVKGAAL